MKYNLPSGFRLSSSNFGLKKNSKKEDVCLIFCEQDADTAAVFTKNIFAGAPIILNKKNLEISKNKFRAILINTVFSNSGTGPKGLENAKKVQKFLAEKMNIDLEKILISSTGIIGQHIPVKKFFDQIPDLLKNFDNDIEKAGKAILTTDLVEKIVYEELPGGGKILGIAKGSGMIAPNMATMLSFVMTDIQIDPEILQKKWTQICEKTFNCISVDGCESTSDSAFVFCSQKYTEDEKIFFEKLFLVAQNLAKKIAADGEGATHLISATAKNCESKNSAKKLSRAIITSDLLKCAICGHDPNWGRIISAIGSTKENFDTEKIDIFFDGEKVFENGAPIENFDSAKMFQNFEVKILVDFKNGKFSATSFGCDLTKKYVEINAEYST